MPVGIGEVDRVLGGGLVAGAAILVGGEPGVGKSTLLLQAAARLATTGAATLVASAEESVGQIALRARRLGIDLEKVLVTASSDVDEVIRQAEELQPAALVVDSIQTIASGDVDGSPGMVAQVRECGARLVAFAKRSSIPVFIVGHVTKEGSIAGPKLLEHMVDVVLYLEGDPDWGVRLLRNLKNRFGAVHQVGFFEMQEIGLVELMDPGSVVNGGWRGDVPGTVLFPSMEGRRPLLLEVQALVAPSSLSQPRRSVKGLETARVHQLIAVLERHGAISFTGQDVFVSVVGGFRVREPGADLAVALALASSRTGEATNGVAAWGEVGLTGEVRSVGQADHRRKEVERMGIATVIAPDEGEVDRISDALRAAQLVTSTPPATRRVVRVDF
jgi:DNA repair protein RadA/Sms